MTRELTGSTDRSGVSRRGIVEGVGATVVSPALLNRILFESVPSSGSEEKIVSTDAPDEPTVNSFRHVNLPPEPGGSTSSFFAVRNPNSHPVRLIANGAVVGPYGVILTDTQKKRTAVVDADSTEAFGFTFQYPKASPPGEYTIRISTTLTTVDELSGDPDQDAHVLKQVQRSKSVRLSNPTHSGPLPPSVRMLATGLINGAQNLLEHVKDFYGNPFAGLLGAAYGVYEGVLTIIQEATSILTDFWDYLAQTVQGMLALLTHAPWNVLSALFEQFLQKAEKHVPNLFDEDQSNAFVVGFFLGLLVFKLLKWYISKRVNTGTFSDLGSGMRKVTGDNSKFSKFSDSLPTDNSSPDMDAAKLKLRLNNRFDDFGEANDILQRVKNIDTLSITGVEDTVKALRMLQRYDVRDKVLEVKQNGLPAEALYYSHLAAGGAKHVDYDPDTEEFVVPDEPGEYVINGLDVNGHERGATSEFDDVLLRVDEEGRAHVEEIGHVKMSTKNVDLEGEREKLRKGIRLAQEEGVKANIPKDAFDPDKIDLKLVGPKNSDWPIQLTYTSDFFHALYNNLKKKLLVAKNSAV